MPLPRIVPLLVLACLLASVTCAPAQAASTLPPELVARLQADRTRAESQLATARDLLGSAAEAQRIAAGGPARVRAQEQLATGVAALASMSLPPRAAARLRSARTELDAELQRRQAALDDATEATARAQAVALDSDRRLRALQRASATEDDRDTTLGSWRFGSGGPAVSAESLDRYLASKGSPLSGQGAAFLESGVDHELDPRLVVAIAGAESYFGITTCAPFNGWGWGCPTSPYRFTSWAQGIETVTLGLREGYLDDGLHSVGEIHLRYAPPDAKNDPTDLNYGWADNVARFLVEQGGDPQDIEGVLGPNR